MSYAREDFNQEWFSMDKMDETTNPVYVNVSTRRNEVLVQFPDAEIMHRVTRDGTDLAVVKQIK
jgi:hypothetical protein